MLDKLNDDQQLIASPLDHALGDISLEERSRVLRAFCDPHRIELIHLLRYGELCASGLLKSLYVSQPTLSHHMKILIESGIVSGREEGRKIFYSIRPEGVIRAMELVQEILQPLERERYRSFFCQHLEANCASNEGCCPNTDLADEGPRQSLGNDDKAS